MSSKGMVSLLSCVFLHIALFSATLEAQTGVSSQERRYSRGRVITNEGDRFEAEKLILSLNTLTFIIKDSNNQKSYPLTEISYASRIGNYTTEGALFGGSLMLLSGLIAVVQAQADPYLELKDNAGLIIVGLTAGGALVGALIGSQLKKEKTIVQKGRFVARVGVPLSIHGWPYGVSLEIVQFQLAF